MARLKVFDVKLDTSEVDSLAASLAGADPAELGKAIVVTLNRVANETYDLSRQKMLRGINLSKTYVERKMEVKEATSAAPTATIRAEGTETNISHYGAVRFTQPVKHPNRVKGDPVRGYSKGLKADGAAAEVARGGAQSIGKKFVIIKGGGLIKDSEGSPIVFRGTGKPGRGGGKRQTPRQGVEPVLGPAVYQLFRFTAEQIYKDVGDNLERAIVETAQRELLRNLK